MMISRRLFSLVISLSLAAAGCGSGEFNEGLVRVVVEASPVKLDGEQVTLTPQQVDCGVQNDLWDMPSEVNRERSLARLTTKGRSLKFDDDVATTDPGYRVPHVQIRGDFMLGVLEVTSMKDGPAQDTKLVDTKVGVKVDHSCFPGPLPLMGLKRGNFTPDVPPVLLFRNNGGWQLEKLVH